MQKKPQTQTFLLGNKTYLESLKYNQLFQYSYINYTK